MNKVFDFFSSVKVELSKVTWPKPELTVRLTVIVILVTVVVGFFLGGIDFLLTKLLELILSK
ncbi:MAG: preprotein translocase subunit SecE [Candidatus Daviesbacteria bacterium]|nr:preprotein translocase subunit SecE [Candidatus Daviesbacteria bacterium]